MISPGAGLGCDQQTVSARRRAPSLFRRLFYREDRFAVLDPVELASIFEAFSCVIRLHPVVVYWVRRLSDDEYLVLAFQHRSMVKYTGLEVVHVTSEQIGYYRLPGAKVGGRGRVASDTYPVSIQSPGRERHHLRIRKCGVGELHLDEVCVPSVPDSVTFLPLAWHPLNGSKFADEMRTIVERGIEWDYQRALLGEQRLLSDAAWVEIARKCAGISDKTDMFLSELGMPHHPGGDEA